MGNNVTFLTFMKQFIALKNLINETSQTNSFYQGIIIFYS